MANAKAWFKLATDWDEVSLKDVTNVANLKEAIKSKRENALKDHDAAGLTLKATHKVEDASQAVKLDARDSLLKVLGRLHVKVQDQSPASVQKCFAENVWLFVYVPSAAVSEILEYQPPAKLVQTSGATWTYQESPRLKPLLEERIGKFYLEYKHDLRDKINSPIFLALGGAGIGKSRLLTELPKIARAAAYYHPEVQQKLSNNCVVFNISFESGTPFDGTFDKTATQAIGTRMLWQLLRGKVPEKSFGRFRQNGVYHLSAEDVLERLSYQGHEASELTVFLMVDGIQKLMTSDNDGTNKSSIFYSCLTTVAAMVISNSAFIIGCCSATIMKPVDDSFASSSQLRVLLPFCNLEAPERDGAAAFNMKHPLVKMLVSDMGGNGRALEILETHIPADIDNCYIADLMHTVIHEISSIYPDVINLSSHLGPILQVILGNISVSKREKIPGTRWRPDQVAEMGLVRFNIEPGELMGTLTCPYVWIWLMARGNKDNKALSNWRFDDYQELQHHHKQDQIPQGAQTWQNFEQFVGDFRVLKSRVWSKQSVSIQKMHPHAQFSADINFASGQLKLICASNRVQTKSGFAKEVHHEYGTVDVTKGEHLVLNGTSASAGDLFCCLKEYSSGKTFNEIIQTKKLAAKSNISLKDYQDEWKKAAQSNDVFLLITTGKSDIDMKQLPSSLCGIVDKSNWNKYFGPFAGRAFAYSVLESPDLNSASRSWLSGIDGIGNKYADTILTERSKCPFLSIENCHNRTKVPFQVLKRCRFN